VANRVAVELGPRAALESLARVALTRVTVELGPRGALVPRVALAGVALTWVTLAGVALPGVPLAEVARELVPRRAAPLTRSARLELVARNLASVHSLRA
jgi:hypothetical protein